MAVTRTALILKSRRGGVVDKLPDRMDRMAPWSA